jgi:hypothetical protein
MRSVLALGLLITLCAPANAATVHRFKPHERYLRPGQGVILLSPKAMRFRVGPTKRPAHG